jgi:hypothetical protein
MTDTTVASVGEPKGVEATEKVDQNEKSTTNEPLESLCGKNGEWESRKISIMGVVKRFISQLSYGQELTRISMPSEFLNPYSILEVCAVRYLTRFDSLITANAQTSPAYRMLHVIHFFLSSLYRVKLYKKPYNPIVGETHYCFTESGGKKTRYLAEQVTHHPPVSAFYMDHEEAGVSAQGTISFGVKFHVNSATVATNGAIRVKLDKHNEEYIFAKSIPDLLMKNVVFGTRQMKWQKTIDVTCPNSGFTGTIAFQDSGSSDTLSGVISKGDEPILRFEGSLDDEVYFFEEEAEDETLFISQEDLKDPKIFYPPQLDEYPSLAVWQEVTKCIVANDMTEADRAKQAVEEAQRVRVRAGEDEKKDRKYFKFDETVGEWRYKEGTFVLPS